MESIIEVQDVTKSFKGVTVLHQINVSYYNRFTVQGTAASRVFFRIVAKAVRMRESWPDVCLQGP